MFTGISLIVEYMFWEHVVYVQLIYPRQREDSATVRKGLSPENPSSLIIYFGSVVGG